MYAGEVCNGLDDDFNGAVDEGIPPLDCDGTEVPACVDGVADTCVPEGATVDLPITGNRARLSDLPKKRETLVVSYDQVIDVSTLDPTVSGATLRIASAAGGALMLDLPASGWRGPLPGGRFVFVAKDDPTFKVTIVDGRLLRVSLRGTGAYPLGAPQTSVAVSLTIDSTRFCTVFSGAAVTRDDGTRFLARKVPAPATCPADG